MDTIIAFLIAVVGLIGMVGALLIYGVVSGGYVCMKFWQWFVLPIFPSLPDLNLGQCIGLMFFISFFKNSHNTVNTDEKANWSKMFGHLMSPWLTLLIGYLFYLWIR